MTRPHQAILLLLIISVVIAAGQEIPPVSDTAEAHHQRGVEYHLRRCLDDASREYARALELDPPRELNSEEWSLVRRFAPRLYTTPSEFFPLKDFAVILHPAERLIAYHFFWQDDIDFPEDNDPCDHEVVWVHYDRTTNKISDFYTYFHGRLLHSSEAVEDAHRHEECARQRAVGKTRLTPVRLGAALDSSKLGRYRKPVPRSDETDIN